MACALIVCAGTMTVSAGTILPDNADYHYSGDTSLGGTFNRPVANGNMAPDTLSVDADNVGYDAFSFQVTTQGLYNIEIMASDLGFDSYLFLYQNSFDPSASLANVLLGDSNDNTTSSFTSTLFENTVYIVVATGFSDFDGGPYTGEITEIAPSTPEPATFVLTSPILLLLVALAWRTKARRHLAG
jgi:hypothetical protein